MNQLLPYETIVKASAVSYTHLDVYKRQRPGRYRSDLPVRLQREHAEALWVPDCNLRIRSLGECSCTVEKHKAKQG